MVRLSIRLVTTVRSARASSAHSATERTLCPTSSPMSQSRVRKPSIGVRKTSWSALLDAGSAGRCRSSGAARHGRSRRRPAARCRRPRSSRSCFQASCENLVDEPGAVLDQATDIAAARESARRAPRAPGLNGLLEGGDRRLDLSASSAWNWPRSNNSGIHLRHAVPTFSIYVLNSGRGARQGVVAAQGEDLRSRRR